MAAAAAADEDEEMPELCDDEGGVDGHVTAVIIAVMTTRCALGICCGGRLKGMIRW